MIGPSTPEGQYRFSEDELFGDKDESDKQTHTREDGGKKEKKEEPKKSKPHKPRRYFEEDGSPRQNF